MKKWNPTKKKGSDGIPTERSNAMRAESAHVAVSASLAHRGDPDVLDRDSISDILADLGHLCDREGEDFLALIETAKLNWEMER
jgi:hypothetical protein